MVKSFKDVVKGVDKPFGVDGKLAKWNVRKDLLIDGLQNAKSFMARERHVTLMTPEQKEKMKENIGKAWESVDNTFSVQNSNKATWVVSICLSAALAVGIGYLCTNGLRTDPKIQLMRYLDKQVITAISPMEAKQMYSDKTLVTMRVGGKTYDVIQGNVIQLNDKQRSIVDDDLYVLDMIKEAKDVGMKFEYGMGKVKDANVSKDSKMVRVTNSLDISQNHKADEITIGVVLGIISGVVGFLGLILAYAGLDKLRGY